MSADLLARVLTSGKSSLLDEDLVYRRELARNVTSYLLPTELTAPFTIVATANPRRPVDDLERAIVEHLERLASEGPAEADLERARNRVLTGLYREAARAAGLDLLATPRRP